MTEIQLENTLLSDAVQKGKARFVSDCASYIQSCMKPATDIFISGQVRGRISLSMESGLADGLAILLQQQSKSAKLGRKSGKNLSFVKINHAKCLIRPQNA